MLRLQCTFVTAVCCLALSCAAIFWGCTGTHDPSDAVLPDDFSFEHRYSTGSLPPPYSYRLVVSAEAQTGLCRAVVVGHLPSGPCSLAVQYDAEEDTLLALHLQMRDNRIFRSSWTEVHCPVGGPVRWLEVFADGNLYTIPPVPGAPSCVTDQESLNETCDRIWSSVPASIRDSLMAAHETWIEEWP